MVEQQIENLAILLDYFHFCVNYGKNLIGKKDRVRGAHSNDWLDCRIYNTRLHLERVLSTNQALCATPACSCMVYDSTGGYFSSY